MRGHEGFHPLRAAYFSCSGMDKYRKYVYNGI